MSDPYEFAAEVLEAIERDTLHCITTEHTRAVARARIERVTTDIDGTEPRRNWWRAPRSGVAEDGPD